MAESILIQWLARELNVDRLSLAGRLLGGRASEVEAKRKFTVAEAFETWTARSEGEESRNRSESRSRGWSSRERVAESGLSVRSPEKFAIF